MILKTKTFQEAANKILVAVGLDRANANLELAAKDNRNTSLMMQSWSE